MTKESSNYSAYSDHTCQMQYNQLLTQSQVELEVNSNISADIFWNPWIGILKQCSSDYTKTAQPLRTLIIHLGSIGQQPKQHQPLYNRRLLCCQCFVEPVWYTHYRNVTKIEFTPAPTRPHQQARRMTKIRTKNKHKQGRNNGGGGKDVDIKQKKYANICMILDSRWGILYH